MAMFGGVQYQGRKLAVSEYSRLDDKDKWEFSMAAYVCRVIERRALTELVALMHGGWHHRN
jgi:hypothetical protein